MFGGRLEDIVLGSGLHGMSIGKDCRRYGYSRWIRVGDKAIGNERLARVSSGVYEEWIFRSFVRT